MSENKTWSYSIATYIGYVSVMIALHIAHADIDKQAVGHAEFYAACCNIERSLLLQKAYL